MPLLQMGSQLSILMTLALLLILAWNLVEAAEEELPNATTTTSQWLNQFRTRRRGCRFRPWICRDRSDPFRRMMCCRNRCVDVSSDSNNCGLCRIRCPFTWRCCQGVCFDVMVNPFHCGDCATRCPFGSRCLFGLCGYAAPLPPFPFPFPFPPKHPKSPFPFPLPPQLPKPPFPIPFPPQLPKPPKHPRRRPAPPSVVGPPALN